MHPVDAVGRWPSHCPPASCAAVRSRGAGTDLRGPSPGVARPSRNGRSVYPLDLWRRLSRRIPVQAVRCFHTGLPLLGLSKNAPPSRDRGVHSRLAVSPPFAFGSALPHADHVPPPWFLTTSAGCSFSIVAGYFTRLATMGFAVFLLVASQHPHGAVSALQSFGPRPQRRRGQLLAQPWAPSPALPGVASVSVQFTGHLALSPFTREIRLHELLAWRPQGLSPRPEPAVANMLPCGRSPCSLGLVPPLSGSCNPDRRRTDG